MKLYKAIGEGTALGSIIILILFFCLLSYNGVVNGVYQLTIDSNTFYEHWFELGLLVLGFVCYIYTRKIKIRFKKPNVVN